MTDTHELVKRAEQLPGPASVLLPGDPQTCEQNSGGVGSGWG